MADERFYIKVTYGTLEPCRMTLLGDDHGELRVMRQYYHDARKTGRVCTDAEYYTELEKLAGDTPVCGVVVDPPAASFVAAIKRHGRFSVFDSMDAARKEAEKWS